MRSSIHTGGWTLAILVSASALVHAQTEQAAERRAERNARQAIRQAARADYYTPQAWNELNPWLERAGVAPIARAADAAADAVQATTQAGVDVAVAPSAAVAPAAPATAVAPAIAVPSQRQYVYRDYGYRDTTPSTPFFYDYYGYTPTYYYGLAEGDRYAGAIRYYDTDNDGVYDYQSYYRDSDNDGVYDQYDRVDFYVGAEARADAAVEAYALSDARRYRAVGEIKTTKVAEVNGMQHLLVGMDYEGELLAVDLGPAADLRRVEVEEGQGISATGTVDMIGDRRILFADSAQIGDQEIIIDRRPGATLVGQIVDVTTTRVGAAQHYIAVIDVDGQRQLVDMGPVTAYRAAIAPSTRVEIYGVPVMANQHRVIMADRVRFGDAPAIVVDRSTIRF